MQLVIKVLISACVIGLCSYTDRKLPSLAGLIADMPLWITLTASLMVWIESALVYQPVPGK